VTTVAAAPIAWAVSPFLRGRPFIEATPLTASAEARSRVAVPPGTALHRGSIYLTTISLGAHRRRSSGDGPSSRPARRLAAIAAMGRRSSGDGPSSRLRSRLWRLIRVAVAVPPGTALHRGMITSTATPASPAVAVPPGTALHRGGDSVWVALNGIARRRSSGDGPSSRLREPGVDRPRLRRRRSSGDGPSSRRVV